MKNDNIIKLEVTAAPGSILEKMLQKFLEDRTERRKNNAEKFLRRKEIQFKKIDSRL